MPSYEEHIEYAWMNPYIRSLTGYFEDDEGEIYSSMTATFCYYGVDTNHKATKTIGSYTIIDDKGDIYYVGDLERSSTTSYSTTSTPLSRLSKSLTGIKTFYGKVEYDQMYGGEFQKREILTFKEDVIEIKDKEIKGLSFGTHEDIAKALNNYSVEETKDGNKKKITNRFEFISNVEYKYHIDYQLFGVDENGKVYDLIGVYNFTNNYSKYLNLETRYPEKLEFKYFIGIFKIIINGESTTIYLKENIE